MRLSTGVDLRPVTPLVGAEVDGVDLRDPLDPNTAELLGQALLDHGVLFFHDQDLTREQFHSFLCNFGEPIVDPYSALDPSSKIIDESDLGPTRRGTAVWHSDSTFLAEPPAITALRAVELPDAGGDTCWASAYEAYETLSAPVRTMLDALSAVNSLKLALGVLASEGQDSGEHAAVLDRFESVQPVVRVHPVTGRKALFVTAASTTRIVELTSEESAHVLALLFEHVKSPEFAMRHRWSVNDIAIWDNRSVMHYAVPDYEGRRVMQRVVLAGDRPIGPVQP
jgi:alpha-ketoglutarate-dependent taurine dioxygenase